VTMFKQTVPRVRLPEPSKTRIIHNSANRRRVADLSGPFPAVRGLHLAGLRCSMDKTFNSML
jgi:hypothetical protein